MTEDGMPIALLGSVDTVVMLGESHCLAFDGLLFQPQGQPDLLLCRSCFLPAVPAHQFCMDGQMNPALTAALCKEELLDPHMQAAYLSRNASVAYIAGRPVMAPLVVVFGGDVELVSHLYMQLGDVYDFDLPDDPGYGIARNKQPVPYAQVHAQVARLLQPMLEMLALLQHQQLRHLVVHGLPPRNPDQAAASLNAAGPMPNVAVRSKLAVVVNRQLKAACIRMGLGFIDIWPETTAQGVLRPEFALDGIHLNRKAALISLEKIAALLIDQTRNNANMGRYARAAALAHPCPDGAQAHQTLWTTNGLLAVQTDPGIAATLAAWMQFENDQGNSLARTDWVGSARQARPGLGTARPGTDVLKHLGALLNQEPLHTALHAGAAHALTVYSVRPQRSAQTVVYAPHSLTTPVPPEIRCAVLHLAGSAQYVFESVDEATPTVSVVDAQVGLVLVFDPRRWRYRVSAPSHEFAWTDLALGPRLQGQPFRVMWADGCEWPADPFHYSVQGMEAYPPMPFAAFSARATPGCISNTV